MFQKLYSACEHRKGNGETAQTTFTAVSYVKTNANALNGQWICPICEVENLNQLRSCVECGYEIVSDEDSDGVENQSASTARPKLDIWMLYVALVPVIHELSFSEDIVNALASAFFVFVIINAAGIALQLLITRDTKLFMAVLLDFLQVFIHMLVYVLLLPPLMNV